LHTIFICCIFVVKIPLMKKEKTVDFHIKWAWHAISKMYNIYASPEEMTMSIGYVLLNIDTENGTPATKIGPSIGMEPRSLTRMLKNLEEKGWIYRMTDETDKRFVKVFLTELGKQKRNFARQGVIDFNTNLVAELGEDKLKSFFEIISQLNDFVNKSVNESKLQIQNIEEEFEV
jgi:MarR family transcriptional regulator, organic hydroperoxide resistance regulator